MPKSETAASKTKSKRGTTQKSDAKKKPVRRRRKKDWASLMENINEDVIVDYHIDGDFSDTEAIRHKSFGIGVITKVLDENKIEVIFEENEKKILAQNWE